MTLDKSNNTDISAVELLQNINSGLADPKLLDKSSRQRCVEMLIGEGYAHSQISQVLRISEKTVGRDIKEIHARNSLRPDLEFATQFIGQLHKNGLAHHSHLVRLARAKEATPSEKAQAEFLAWRIFREMSDKLQSLGYLPTMPRQLELMTDAQDNELSLEELKTKISTIEATAKDCGNLTPDVSGKINKLKLRIEKYEVQERAIRLLEEQKEDNLKMEDNNEEENQKSN